MLGLGRLFMTIIASESNWTRACRDLRLKLEAQCRLPTDEEIANVWVEGFPLASVYAYRGLLRKLLLDFKIKGTWQSGMALVEIFCSDPGVVFWARDCDCVMPVPSSFWGRWHGKHDLAFALAEGLSQRLGLPLIKAPRLQYFRFKKQSFLTRNERLAALGKSAAHLSPEDVLKDFPSPEPPADLSNKSRRQVLLIDDIVTSAKTLTALARGSRNNRFRFLTLASAYHKTDGTIRSAGEKL